MLRRLGAAVLVLVLAVALHNLIADIRNQRAFSLANASLSLVNTTFFTRASLNFAIAEALSSRTHLLLLGPSGVGKTVAVQLAATISTPLAAPGGNVCLLPLYVDLHSLLTEHTVTDEESARAAAVHAFSKAVLSLDFPSLRDAVSSSQLALWRFAHTRFSAYVLDMLEPWFWLLSLIPRQYELSVHGLLSHVVDAAEALSRAAQCDHGAGRMLPVLILDEVHVLNETHMAAVRADVLRFIWPQLQAKQSARITIVLLSSDARAHDIVETWTPAKKLARRLNTMHVGDLQAHQVPQFLSFLERSASSPHGVDLSAVAPTRFNRTEDWAKLAYARAGGHVGDLRRLFVADYPHDVFDVSSVASLASSTELHSALAAFGLDPHHVATVFEAILRGVSARGAVLLANLTAAKVPGQQIRAMEVANLVEIRRYGMAGGADYEELRAFAPATYVCAPRPMARESMAQVLAVLRGT